MALGWPYLVHAFFERFNGDTPFAPLLDATYAPLTSWSVALLVAFDQDAGDKVSQNGQHCDAMVEPRKFYVDGPLNKSFNIYLFAKWMLTASVHGVVVWLACVKSLAHGSAAYNNLRVFWLASFSAFTCLLIVVHVRLAYICDMKLFHGTTWRQKFGGMALMAELLAYFLGCIVFSFFLQGLPDPDPDGGSGGPLAPFCPDCTDMVIVPFEAAGYWQFWACNIGIPLSLLLFDVVMRRFKNCLQEREKAPAHCQRCGKDYRLPRHEFGTTFCCNNPLVPGHGPLTLIREAATAYLPIVEDGEEKLKFMGENQWKVVNTNGHGLAYRTETRLDAIKRNDSMINLVAAEDKIIEGYVDDKDEGWVRVQLGCPSSWLRVNLRQAEDWGQEFLAHV
jgi:hypothetical protein